MPNEQLLQDLKQQLPQLKQGAELLVQAQAQTFWPSPIAGWQWPRQGMSLLLADRGLGATQWWLHTARAVSEAGQWSLWVEDPQLTLYAPALYTQHFPLKNLLVLRGAQSQKDLLWGLHEVLQAQLVRWIALPLTTAWRRQDLLWLARQCEVHHVHALMFTTQLSTTSHLTQFFRAVLQLQGGRLHILKSKQHSSGVSLESPGSYASLLSQLSSHGLFPHQRNLSALHPPATVSRARPAVG